MLPLMLEGALPIDGGKVRLAGSKDSRNPTKQNWLCKCELCVNWS